MSPNHKPAVLGGAPLFKKPFHLVSPALPELDGIVAGIKKLYRSRILSNQGEFVKALEGKIAAKTKVKHCALFCNGTIALMSLVRALDLKGNVLVPSFTFAATTQALLWQNIRPRFVDIDRRTFTMDPDKIEAAITRETSAILPVNLFGNVCAHEKIAKIARKSGLALIYDSAQAFGSRYKGKPAGSLGKAEMLSFHATKPLHTGEGGAVVTNDSKLYERLCRIRNFGFAGYLNCSDAGINGKMSEFSALIGLGLFDDLEPLIAKRKRIFRRYDERLKNFPGIGFPQKQKRRSSNFISYHITIDPERFGLSSLELNYALTAERIVSRCYFYPPVHRTTYYQKLFRGEIPHLPETDWAALSLLCLPVHGDMTDGEIEKIVLGIARCRRHCEQIRKRIFGRIPRGWESLRSFPGLDPHEKYILGKRI